MLVPDHVPELDCPAPWHAGHAYTVGYMKALVAPRPKHVRAAPPARRDGRGDAVRQGVACRSGDSTTGREDSMSLRTGRILAAASALALLAGAARRRRGRLVDAELQRGARRASSPTKFEAANPGITVKLEITTSDGLPQRVLTALQSGAPPDIIEVQHGWVNGYAQNDLRACRSTTCSRTGTTTSRPRSTTSPGTASSGRIPYRIETHAVIYNKGDFTAAGLDPEKPPQTWTELVDAATKLTGKDGKSGFAITGGGEVGNTIFRSLPFIWMNGGSIISEDMTKATVNEPAAVEAVTFYTDFFKNGLSPASTLRERRHRQPPALHRRDGVDVPVRPVRRRPRSARRTPTSTSA